MNIIRALFQRKPKEFSRKVEVFYDKTQTFYVQGTLKKGDQIFTDNYVHQTSIQEWIYHVFNFEFQGEKYSFKVRDDEKRHNFENDTTYKAYLKINDVEVCWFLEEERNVYLWVPDDDDDDDWE